MKIKSESCKTDVYEFEYEYKFMIASPVRFVIRMVGEGGKDHRQPMTHLYFILKHGSTKKFEELYNKICRQLSCMLLKED